MKRYFVEVYFSGYWGRICPDDSWDDKAATVVCKQLGYTTGKSYSLASSNDIYNLIMMRHVRCEDTEANLGHCLHAGWGTYHQFMEFDCQYSNPAYVAAVSCQLTTNQQKDTIFTTTSTC